MRTMWVSHEEPCDLTPVGSVTCSSQKNTRGAAGCPTDGPVPASRAKRPQPRPRSHGQGCRSTEDSVVPSTVSEGGQDRKDPSKFSHDRQEEDGHLVRTDNNFF